MNPHGLLTILEKQKEKYVLQYNNEKQIKEIIKEKTSLSYILNHSEPITVFVLSLCFAFLSIIITKLIVSFIDPYREHIFIDFTIFSLLLVSSIFCGALLVKFIYKWLFNKKINKQEIIESILEEKFYGEKVSDEALSYLKIILTDDEYFELMKDKLYINNKEALDVAKLKIHKEDILMDKKKLVLDLKRLKEYKIQINS
ncbi:hypothetical protein ACTOJ1_000655 [Shigella flexneri]